MNVSTICQASKGVHIIGQCATLLNYRLQRRARMEDNNPRSLPAFIGKNGPMLHHSWRSGSAGRKN